MKTALERAEERAERLLKQLEEAHHQIGALKWELGWRLDKDGGWIPPAKGDGR